MSSQPTSISEPHDTCFRCGKPTPLGVPLCENDNPGRIKGPSTTQVHGTIVIGIIVGFILVGALGRFALSGGPFEANVLTSAAQDDGQGRPAGGAHVELDLVGRRVVEHDGQDLRLDALLQRGYRGRCGRSAHTPQRGSVSVQHHQIGRVLLRGEAGADCSGPVHHHGKGARRLEMLLHGGSEGRRHTAYVSEAARRVWSKGHEAIDATYRWFERHGMPHDVDEGMRQAWIAMGQRVDDVERVRAVREA